MQTSCWRQVSFELDEDAVVLPIRRFEGTVPKSAPKSAPKVTSKVLPKSDPKKLSPQERLDMIIAISRNLFQKWFRDFLSAK